MSDSEMGEGKGRPPATSGMRHVALNVTDMSAAEHFYVELLGMQVEWRPDEDNVYLTSGNDNLALHRADDKPSGPQHLDHIGFIIPETGQVDQWYEFLNSHDIEIFKPPRTHRDGARSFYCRDPDGNVVQMIYHPPLANQ
jgi:catechol 2,3-dioxygenase-like lactoylglutathione lyase family enzyme